MTRQTSMGPLARVLVRVGSWVVPRGERERFRSEWTAELEAHRAWLEEKGSAVAGLRVAAQALGAVTDGLTLGWEGGVATIIGDVRFAVRALVRRKRWSALAIMTLALGIGATSALYALIDGVLLRPLPFPDPSGLVLVEGVDRGEVGPPTSRTRLTSEADFRDFQARTRTLGTLAGWEGREGIVRMGESTPEWAAGAMVTERFFETLGVAPRMGRAFTPEEHRAMAPVIVLSDALWRRHFRGDREALGKSLEVDGTPLTVIGVMPAGFRYPETAEFWRPTHARPADPAVNASQDGFGRDWRTLAVVGRLDGEATVEEALAEFEQITARLATDYPTTNTGRSAAVVPLHSAMVASVRGPLLALLGAVSLLLLIACLNVGCLLLVRVSARADEVAVRTALGADRSRLIRQLLTESVVLAVAGGLAGLVIGNVALDILLGVAPVTLPRAETLGLDVRTIVPMTLVSALAGIAFGAVPALRATRGSADTAGMAGRRSTASAGRHRLLGVLAVAQIGLSTLLVIGAGLFMRSFSNVMDVDHGYATEGLSTFQLAIDWDRYPGWDQFAGFFARSRERLARVPGITAVEHVNSPPLSAGWTAWYHVIGRPAVERGDRPTSMIRSVTPGYLPLAGIELVAGRGFSVGDDATAPGVAIVNQSFADQVFGGVEAALGQSLEKPQFWGTDYPDAHRIVGVVADTRAAGLDQASPTMIFLPFEQAPMGNNMMLVRTDLEAAELGRALRTALLDIDPLLPLRGVQTQTERFEASIADRRFAMQLSAAFGLVAYLLSAIGLHGVVASSVAERRRELGIKRALGATDPALAGEVLGRSLRLGVAGVTTGLLGATVAAGLVRANLFGIHPLDWPTYLLAGGVVLLATLVAAWVPARRAMSVDPRWVIDG